MRIYGKPPFRIEEDVTDLVGLRTLIYSKMWQASRWPMSDAELQEEKPAPPQAGGGMMFFGDQTRPVGGGLRTYWTFRGIAGDGRTVTFKDRVRSFDSSFKGGFEVLDIRLLPQIQALVKKYGGIVDPSTREIIFPPTVPEDSESPMKKSAGAGEQNPMYGREHYQRITGTYTHHYLSLSPPSQAKANRIHKSSSLPGRPPADVQGDWLMAPTPYTDFGVCFDCTELYILNPDGWPEPIHKLATTSGSNSGGLTTGSLTKGSV